MKRKIIYALLSVVIAFGLWIYVITTVSPEWEETYYNIPVVLNNETVLHDNGLMLLEEQTPTVTLKLSGKRSDLATLNRGNITIIANLATIYETGEQRLFYTISYPGNIPDNSIEVLSKDPQVLTLTVADRKSVQVPVSVDYNGTVVPDGYRTDKENLELDYKEITVTGPSEVVDQIEYAEVLVDLENKTESINQAFGYVLCDKDGNPVDDQWLTANTEEVNVKLKIQPYKDLALLLDVTYGGGANEKNTTVTLNMEKIPVAGSKQLLEALGEGLVIPVDLRDIPVSATIEYPIELPEGVENLAGVSTVSVTITYSDDLVIKVFEITNIEPQNVPGEVEVNLLTQKVKVTIRGSKAKVESLKAEDLTVLVDFSGAEIGTDTYKVTLKDAKADYGLLGDPVVDATVTKK